MSRSFAIRVHSAQVLAARRPENLTRDTYAQPYFLYLASLANYKVPRRVELSDTELPKSGSGKILKRILRERFWADQKRAVG